MTTTSCSKGVWALEDTYKKINLGYLEYDPTEDVGALWSLTGANDTVVRSSPVQIPGSQWTKFSQGNGTLSLKCDGTLWTWGTNFNGVLGINLNQVQCNATSSPIQIPGTQWCQVNRASGTAYAVKTDGTLWVWGYGATGVIGNNTNSISYSSPVQIPGTQWVEVSGRSYSVAAKKSDGTVWLWGTNDSFQITPDNPNFLAYSSPISLAGTWKSIDSGSGYTAGIKSDNSLWVWGYNNGGRLGIGLSYGAAPYRSTPVQIPGTQWFCTNVACISAALKTDGTLWTWGYGSTGVLGQGTGTDINSPGQVPGTSWRQIGGATINTLFGKKTDGTLWVWGYNGSGELGANDTVNRSSPIQIPGQWDYIPKNIVCIVARKRL